VQCSLARASLQRDPEQVSEALHEGDIGLGEPALDRTVHFQDAVADSRGDDRDVDRPPDPVLHQDLRRAEALLVLQVPGDDGLARLEGIAGGAIKVGTCLGPDHTGFPTHPDPNDELVLVRQILHDFAEPGIQAFSAEPRRLLE
jgi:hypothetical protein